MVIPKSLQEHKIAWYHHYLQHPRHNPLEKSLKATITWAGMHNMVQRHINSNQGKWFYKNKTIGLFLLIPVPMQYTCSNLVQ